MKEYYQPPDSDWLNDQEDDEGYDIFEDDQSPYPDDAPDLEDFVDILNHQAWDEYPNEE